MQLGHAGESKKSDEANLIVEVFFKSVIGWLDITSHYRTRAEKVQDVNDNTRSADPG